MGYSEQVCQICGVSFNIARIRRSDEPRSAAWIHYGEDFVEAEGTIEECGPDSGCLIVDRNRELDVLEDPWKTIGSERVLWSVVGNAEHIAGSECNSTNGYSGQRLSLQEMNHCRLWQCLVRKPDDPSLFQSSPDDEAFEREGDVFLSGISDDMPETEMGGAQLCPVRHGVESPDVTNGILESVYTNVKEACMPFHPWCLEVFKRASHAKTGKVDVAGLWGWYENEADFEMFNDFPRTGPTEELRQQWWSHERGSEWIVCNPLFMPNLSDSLQAAISLDSSFDPGQGAFEIIVEQHSTSSSPQDPFATLPTELRLVILHDLSSKDIAALRLSSRAFRQLPISLWHYLVEKEFPWFWEAKTSSLPTYSFWTTTSEREFKEHPLSPADRQPVPVPNTLDSTRTNWHKLYLVLKQRDNDSEYRSLRGVRNRERIWKDCEEILRRIEVYRERNEIPVLDLAKLVSDRTEAVRRQNRERMEACRRERERGQGIVTHTAAAQPL